MSKIKQGVIRFERYEVEEVRFRLNPLYDEREVDIALNMEEETETDVLRENMRVRLRLHIFDKAEERGYPFEMHVVLAGDFSIGLGENEEITQYQANAIAILYPYIRAVVSTYTAVSNVTPLVLPTINVNEFLRQKKNTEE